MASLDSLFHGDDGEDSSIGGPHHSIGVSGASTAQQDPSFRTMTFHHLFSSPPPPLPARLHSLPTLLHSESDAHEFPPPLRTGKSLHELIDADHPSSTSEGDKSHLSSPQTPASPCSPKRLRSAGPISRPCLLAKATASLRSKPQTGGEAGYASDADTVSAEGENLNSENQQSSSPSPPVTPPSTPSRMGFFTDASAGVGQSYTPLPSLEQRRVEEARILRPIAAPGFFQTPTHHAQLAPVAPPPLPLHPPLHTLTPAPHFRAHQPPGFAPLAPHSLPPAPASPPAPAAAPSRPSPRGGKLVELAVDKKGSRQLQDALPLMSDAQLSRACDELSPQLLMLALHPAANYVVSRLASLPPAHSHLLAALKGHVPTLINHPQGSRVVQALVSELPLPAASLLASELQGHVLSASLDTHGSWGVCACYKRTHLPFILADVCEHLPLLSIRQHGCRVVQRVLAEAAACGAGVSRAAQVLLSSDLSNLAVDPYGNYAVQVTLRHAEEVERNTLVSRLLPLLLHLATSKHGSNVAEATLTRASHSQLLGARYLLLGERSTLRELTGHPYGNYVLQALLRLLPPSERASAVRTIELEASDTSFGRTIVTHFAQARP
ncbi:MAG: hypothetical protein SGPRY_009668 [Prymnesium sp.]